MENILKDKVQNQLDSEHPAGNYNRPYNLRQRNDQLSPYIQRQVKRKAKSATTLANKTQQECKLHTNMSLDTFQREQDLNVYVSGLKQYVKTGKIKDNMTQSTVNDILKAAHYYVIVNNVFRYKNLLPPVTTEECLLFVVPTTLVQTVIKAHHTNPMAPHIGINKTIGVLRQMFTWPNMAQDIINTISSCERCAIT